MNNSIKLNRTIKGYIKVKFRISILSSLGFIIIEILIKYI
jgi:hypothetical protein